MRGPEESVPVNLQVFHDPVMHPEMNRVWTNEDVKLRMSRFYRNHPEFAKTPEPPALEQKNEDAELITNAVQIEDLIRSRGFQSQYSEAMESSEAQEQNLLEEIIAYYSAHLGQGTPVALEVASLLVERASDIYGSVPYQLDWSLIRQLIGNHAKQFIDSSEREQ